MILSFLRFLCLVLVIAGVLVSCKPPTATQDATGKADPIEGLVFLIFVMRSDSISGTTVELTGKTIVRQKLKSDPPNSSAVNRVWISQLTDSGTKLSSVALDHPLFKRVEFANDQGKFESKEITLNDAEFFARVTLFNETAYILVEEDLSGKIAYSIKFKLRD